MIVQVVWASPKSLYLVANHHTRQFDAWEIKPDGTATYQATYWLSYATDPAGIAIDESSNTLFITSEFSGGVEMVDATTMTSLGVSTGPSDLAGIAVDDAKNIVYTVKRYSNVLYAYDWNPVARTLTLKSGYPISLPGCSGAFGIALDEIRGVLWVADSAAGVVRAYDVNTWTEDASRSFTPSHKPVDVAVDRWRGFVYTVSMSAAAYVPPGCGSKLLSKYDLATRTETTCTLVDQGVGVAVDEVTGLVYVTLSPYGRGLYQGDLSVWDTSTIPWTQVQIVKVSGSPAGICIPQEEVAYNPLGLAKDDGLAEGEYISPAFGKIGSAFPSLDDHPLRQLPATSGKISWFSSEELGSTGAWGEWLGENVGTDDATKYWYCAMRWPYATYEDKDGDGKVDPGSIQLVDSAAKNWWHNKKILVTNPANGKQVVLAAKDWGPGILDRVIDVSKTALDVLGAETDEVVNIAFADQNAKLGPVENDVIIYKIYYDNTKNNIDVHNVRITDTLPAEVSFISTITSSGSYDPSTHTVTWNIGTLPAWATQQCVHLVVRIYPTVEPGSTITNYATIDSDETLPTTVSESTDISPLPDEIGLLVTVTATPPEGKDYYEINDEILFEVTVTNPSDVAGTDLTAYYVKLSVIEPEEIEIYIPAGRMDIAKISPGESRSTTFYGTAIKSGDNVEVIVNAWGYTDLSAEVGKIRGRGSCTITIHDPIAPKPDWSFAVITDLHIGYNSKRWDSDNDGYIVGEIDYASAGWDDTGPYDPETIERLDYGVTRNLENAIDKIITEKGPYNIKFVVVLGDISDTAEKSEFLKAREILNRLNDPNGDGNTEDGIPYIPVFGNHDPWPYCQDILGKDDRYQYSSIAPYAKGDEFFKEIFWGESNRENKELIDKLFGDSWEYTYNQPVHIKARWLECCGYEFEVQWGDGNKYYDKSNKKCTIKECDYYLQNYGFVYDGITFVCLDLIPRLGEDRDPGDGNALPGAVKGIATNHPETIKFSEDYVERHKATERRKIILFSHHPLGDVFNYIPMVAGYKLYNFYGHYHLTGDSLETVHPFNEFYKIMTEDVADIVPEWLDVVEHRIVKWMIEKMGYKRTRETVRIVQIKNGEVAFSTTLKPKSVEIRWPFPDFAYSYASYPEPEKAITFTAHFTSYHGFETSFDWDFGDGTHASGLSVTHSYSQDGEYNVTLTVTTKNLVTGEEKTYTITRPIYVHSKHVISNLPPDLNATSLLTGEDVTQVPQNTYHPVLLTRISSEEIPIAHLGVHFEEAAEDINLLTLVADVDFEEGKSLIYMPSWPEEIDDYKTLFIPSTGVGTVYICLDAKSLNEVSLENADLIINVGETKDNITVTTTFYNGREYYLVFGVTGTGGGELKDTVPPTTILTIGEPKYVTEITYVTPDTPFILSATDDPGGTGVALTAYKIRNTTYDSGWITYTEPFYLTGLNDGTYHIDYNSTDNAGNVEPTQTVTITLFSWNYVFEDTYGRGTALKINIAHKFFQFITPDKDYGIRKATYMRVYHRTITIRHEDNELRLITLAVDTKLDFCFAMAWDVQTGKRYLLIDKPGKE
jgi:uncharacterized repeat protein (TIGR01451 family)